MLRRSSRQPATSVSDGDEVTPPASNDYPNDIENVDEDTGQASNDGEDSFELAPDFDAPLALDYRHSRFAFIVRWLKTKFVEVNDSGITTRQVGASQLHPNQLNDISVMEELNVAETAISSHRRHQRQQEAGPAPSIDGHFHVKHGKFVLIDSLTQSTSRSNMFPDRSQNPNSNLKTYPEGRSARAYISPHFAEHVPDFNVDELKRINDVYLIKQQNSTLQRDIALRDTFLSLVHDNNSMRREMRGNFVGLHQTLQDLKSEMDKISRKLDSSLHDRLLVPLDRQLSMLRLLLIKTSVIWGFGSVKPKISPIFFTDITNTVNISR
ncbi:hypothetical protein BC829DRAFT_417270 [Chytridium lagenaria]|nr:hypothetical protein BC829DRAFT_417270 [Chytridium lagenaria]